MSFILPEEILETLLCCFCGKYLSVSPIKIYKNRKMKCGRCPEIPDDPGIESIYSSIVKGLLFKCINKYEGCRQMLIYNNVKQHENTCISNKYICPVCLEEVWMYLLWNHIKSKHKNSLLNSNYVCINLKSSLENLLLFYKKLDHIFLIDFRFDRVQEKNFLINATLIGMNQQEAVGTQKFTFQLSHDYNVTTSIKPLFSYSSEKLNPFHIKMPFHEKLSRVYIQFDLYVHTMFDIIKLPQIPDFNSTPKNLNKLAVYILQNNCLSLTLRGLPETLCVGNIYISCYNCNELSRNSDTYYKSMYVCESSKYHLLCHYCSIYYRVFNQNKVMKTTQTLFLYNVYNKINFYCKWNCENFFNSNKLYDHEINCLKQPKIECINDCDVELTFPEFINHFEEMHHFSKCERIYYFSVSEFSIKFLPEPLWPYCLCFVWLTNVLIGIKFMWYQGDILIDIKYYSENASKNLKVLLFNENVFWKSVEGKGGKVPTLNELTVKCYLTA